MNHEYDTVRTTTNHNGCCIFVRQKKDTDKYRKYSLKMQRDVGMAVPKKLQQLGKVQARQCMQHYTIK